MNVNLSDKAQEIIDRAIAKGRYRNADAYLECLVLQDFEDIKELEDMLRAGFASGPAVEITPDDIRRMADQPTKRRRTAS